MVDLIWHGVNLAYPVARAAEADVQIQEEALPREFDEYVKKEFTSPGLKEVTGTEVNAATGTEREEWLEAMRRELDAMSQLGVLTVVPEVQLKRGQEQ
jgi:hypothetical protein